MADRPEAETMGFLLRFLTLCKEIHARTKGQTMTEYSLILAAIALAAFVAYTATGQDVNALVSWQAIDKDLLGT